MGEFQVIVTAGAQVAAPPKAILIDVTRRAIKRGAAVVYFRRRPFLIALAILAARGDLVPQAELIDLLWPDPDTQALTADLMVRHYLIKTRLGLDALGLTVAVSWGRGWYLSAQTETPPSQPTRVRYRGHGHHAALVVERF